jgi:protein SMG7
MDNQIWLETSHACIQAYRQRLATLDKAIAEKTTKATNAPSTSVNDESANNTTAGKGRRSETGPVVEHRKVLQRFRQFLAEEEKFFTAFILRLVRSFALDEAIPYLDALQLNRTNPTNDDPSLRKATFPEEQPPLEPPLNQREKKILTVVKALISLGDLARYKEQYNERQGRPKAGAEEVLPRWATKANRRAGENVPRPRNYARASACYTQARLLFPEGGQAFHQLAILSSYQSDTFAGVLYYYRSLCVRVPFNIAFDNLVKTLDKIYVSWKNEGGVIKNIGAETVNEGDDAPKAMVDHFKKDVVILHAIWRTERATYVI